jgi:hypothetical protein
MSFAQGAANTADICLILDGQVVGAQNKRGGRRMCRFVGEWSGAQGRHVRTMLVMALAKEEVGKDGGRNLPKK